MRDPQSGQTLVEVVIGLSVTALVLGALVGVTYTVSDRFANWSDRVTTAAKGFSLAGALEADSRRFAPCGQGRMARLELCGTPSPACDSLPVAVTYLVERTGSGGYVVVRRTGGVRTVVARVVGGAQPTFWVERSRSAEEVVGRIHVYGIRGPVPPNGGDGTPVAGDLSVQYRAPWTPC